MTIQLTKEAKREALRKFLVKSCGGCAIQGPGAGWPCGTCVMALLDDIGLQSTHPLYEEKNDKPNRHNEVWRAILQIRDADLTRDTYSPPKKK